MVWHGAYLVRVKVLGEVAGAISQGWAHWGAERADGSHSFPFVVLPVKNREISIVRVFQKKSERDESKFDSNSQVDIVKGKCPHISM